MKMKDKKLNKGCGRMLAVSSDRDCGAYCPFCKRVHYCVFCGGDYELHPVALRIMAKEMKKKKKQPSKVTMTQDKQEAKGE